MTRERSSRTPGTAAPAHASLGRSRRERVRRLRALVTEAFFTRWATRLAVLYLAALLIVAVLAPVLNLPDPLAQDLTDAFAPPSTEHVLGTDDLGRDVMSRLIHGGRSSLLASGIAVTVALSIGIPLGILAGYFEGRIDTIVMRIFDTILAFPAIILAMTVISVLGGGLVNAMLAVGIVFSPVVARVIRAQVVQAKATHYVETARLLGASHYQVIRRHVLPNSIQPVIVQGALLTAMGLLAEASLSFLGLGVRPPDASWGTMISRGFRYMHQEWLLVLIPGLAIFFASLAFNALGDGLQAALNPRSRGGPSARDRPPRITETPGV